MDMFFFSVPKMTFLSTPKECLETWKKILNVKDEFICYFYKENRIFRFIWSSFFCEEKY